MGYRGRGESSGGLSAECRGWEIRDQEGEKIGKVEEVFVDGNDRPEYLGVKAGLLGGKLTLIPADIAKAADGEKVIEVSESRDRIKEAPSLGSNEEITARRERGIRDHFGLDSGSSEDDSQNQRDRDGDTSELSLGYRQDSEEDQQQHASNQDNERETERGGASEGREPWTNSGDSSDASTESSGESEETSARGTATGYENRGREWSEEAPEQRQGHGGGDSTESGRGETMRVSVWREKARAEKVLGDDGSEEVRIRKQWVEEEEIIEVEDRRQG